MKGLLTAEHPYHRDAEVTHFLARRDGEVVGTVTAAVNRRFNEHYGSRIGFFGFFETIEDYGVAAALLDAAREWVAARGMTALRGPGEYSCATHERQGVLIEGFEYPPTVELTHNPPYYAEFLERYGFAQGEGLRRVHDRREAGGARGAAPRRSGGPRATPHPDASRRDEGPARRGRAHHRHLQRGVGRELGLPAGDAGGGGALADTLLPIVDPQLMRFAYVDGEDRPAAVLGALPDPYWSLRPRWKWYGDSDPVRMARLLVQRRRHPARAPDVLRHPGAVPPAGHRRGAVRRDDAVRADEALHRVRAVDAAGGQRDGDPRVGPHGRARIQDDGASTRCRCERSKGRR